MTKSDINSGDAENRRGIDFFVLAHQQVMCCLFANHNTNLSSKFGDQTPKIVPKLVKIVFVKSENNLSDSYTKTSVFESYIKNENYMSNAIQMQKESQMHAKNMQNACKMHAQCIMHVKCMQNARTMQNACNLVCREYANNVKQHVANVYTI